MVADKWMGCKESKSQNDIDGTDGDRNQAETVDFVENMDRNVDYKSRFEWKMCRAKETPETEFDLSDCNLTKLPSGLFVLCRVLLKDRLLLQNNKLCSLKDGGEINDLKRLQMLNLNWNKFTKIPIDLFHVENLRELFLSHNQILALPDTINRLRHLELLDVSFNRLSDIKQISNMINLRILLLNGNNDLHQLPFQLSTCLSLAEISLDADNFVYPSPEILCCGTAKIIAYLTTGEHTEDIVPATVDDRIMIETQQFIDYEKAILEPDACNGKSKRENAFIEHERLQYQKYNNMDSMMHEQNQQRKQEFLKTLVNQQNETDTMIRQLQISRDVERHKLIEHILHDEKKANEIFDQLLSLKNGQDDALIEQERIEQQKLLENSRIDNEDLRRREVLNAMSELVENEAQQIRNYQRQRDETMRSLLEQETSLNIENVLQTNDRKHHIALIEENEKWQKMVVGAFIERNDARTWGLVEQVRLVESQLATMTRLEIDRKKCEMNERLNDLSDKRLQLTVLLMDLMDQQKERKLQLLDTLALIEAQKESEQNDFWLLQYQKLLDSSAFEMNFNTTSIDPQLGNYFLLNGVIHCIPFLSRLWQTKSFDLSNLTESELIDVGIRNENDRKNILLSIHQYLKLEEAPEAKLSSPKTSDKDDTAMEENASTEVQSECVICMEAECKVIFLPCGHLCCCEKCENAINLCPMCRASIERRIRVIAV